MKFKWVFEKKSKFRWQNDKNNSSGGKLKTRPKYRWQNEKKPINNKNV